MGLIASKGLTVVKMIIVSRLGGFGCEVRGWLGWVGFNGISLVNPFTGTVQTAPGAKCALGGARK